MIAGIMGGVSATLEDSQAALNQRNTINIKLYGNRIKSLRGFCEMIAYMALLSRHNMYHKVFCIDENIVAF